MRHQSKLVALLAIGVVLATIGLTELVWNQGSPREIVASLSGQTYQLRVSDTLRLPAIGSKATTTSKILTPIVSADRSSSSFRATDTGVAVVTATLTCGSQSGVCNAFWGVVVTRQPPVTVAVSGVTGGTFVLRVGEEVIFGYAGVSVRSTSSGVLQPEGWGLLNPGPGLTLFRAVKPGKASLAFRGAWGCADAQVCDLPDQSLTINFIVSSSKTRFDQFVSVRDVGKTIHLHKGQTLEISLAAQPGYEPWRWQPWAMPIISGHVPDQSVLDFGQEGLTDPDTRYLRTQNGWVLPDRAGYLVEGTGTAEIAFEAMPIDCRPADECPRLNRIFEMTIEVDS